MLTATCRKDKCDDATAGCSGCWKAASGVYFLGNYSEDCICIPDSSYTCPSNVVNGYYDYRGCVCRCRIGWTGNNCDKVDSSNFIRFRHGSDTTSLSEIISTNDVMIDMGTHILKGIIPASNLIDSIKIPGFFLSDEVGSYPLCGWYCSNYLEVQFSNGETAYSLSGTLMINSVSGWYDYYGAYNVKYQGTFNSNLYIISTGQTYYVREGVFTVHGI